MAFGMAEGRKTWSLECYLPLKPSGPLGLQVPSSLISLDSAIASQPTSEKNKSP